MTSDSDEDLLATGGAFNVFSDVAKSDAKSFLGRILGDYRITGLIAEGGMGRVYRAERTDGSFERDVAVKISLAGHISVDLRQRFIREQQILASMNHPGVAHLFDAGTTDDGWPFIIMELLDGPNIANYVDERGLSQRETVRLVLPLLDALAFAHSRLIVHRDIKPSNVIVDEHGAARLLDFGIAKLIEGSPEAETTARPMTLQTASPEQLLGEPITVASDIYQVGLLLHRLLLQNDALPQRTLPEAVGAAIEARPYRLSADARRRLAPDLAAILSNCLQPAPADRYRDMNTLRDDLASFLDNKPVSVTAPTLSYRFGKLVRRNPGLSAAITLLIAVLVGGTALYTVRINEARLEAEREAATAEEVITFLTEVFKTSDPQNAMGETVTASELLEHGAARIEEEFPDRPLIRARLQHVISGVYREMGLFREALPLSQSAFALRREYLGMNDRDTLISGNDLSILYDRLERFDESIATYRQVLERQRELFGSDDVQTMKTINNLGSVFVSIGDYESALLYLEEALERRRRVLGVDHSEYASTLNNLPIVYANLGQYEKAEAIFLESVEVSRRINGDKHPSTILALGNTGALYLERQMFDKAESIFAEAWELAVPVLGESGWLTLWMGLNRAQIVTSRVDPGPSPEQLEFAEKTTLFVREHAAESLGEEHDMTLDADVQLSRVRRLQGRHEESLALLESVLAVRMRKFDYDHADVLRTQLERGLTMLELGRIDEAKSLFESVDAGLEEQFGADFPERLANLQNLGRVYALLGDAERAEALYREAADRLSATLGAEEPMAVQAGKMLEAYLAENAAMPTRSN